MKGCWGRKNMSSDNGHSISPLPVVHKPANTTFLIQSANVFSTFRHLAGIGTSEAEGEGGTEGVGG